MERDLPTPSSHPVCLCVAQQQALDCASLFKPQRRLLWATATWALVEGHGAAVGPARARVEPVGDPSAATEWATRRSESTLARQNRHSRFAASCRRPNGELACTHMLFVPSSRADSSYDLFESEWSALARNTRCVQRSPGKNLPFKPILQTHVSMRLLIGRST